MNFQVLDLRPYRFGGNGNLYVGRRSDTNQLVVVKYLRELQIPHFRKAFEREVRLLARQRRGMIRILDWDLKADRPFYVMPYLKAGSITRHAGRLTCGQLQAVASILAQTLASLHATGDAHGDVKPDNVLVSDQGGLEVADPLGSGSLLTKLFSENSGGTPGYMAPEIAAGASISTAGDVYSYGATLYHLATGEMFKQIEQIQPQLPAFRENQRMFKIIAASCQPNPNRRPTMNDILLMLNGTSWEGIQLRRKQALEFVGVACLAGVLMVVGTTMARGGR